MDVPAALFECMTRRADVDGPAIWQMRNAQTASGVQQPRRVNQIFLCVTSMSRQGQTSTGTRMKKPQTGSLTRVRRLLFLAVGRHLGSGPAAMPGKEVYNHLVSTLSLLVMLG